ncbi:universal stress protein [Kordia sp. YSTF-M3]|uniref:Universal stress protein n=1 Tax=Kordia aestuariivivens TaxID=2759037 RepID=A0ABR7QEQ0_9FLAO|nr:universal stress protein [Kordia aestuariivivens]MBC8757050.1 universal stress protein [Kordia aestuariivivens]
MINILLPTDFSDNSLNAIFYAVQLFKEQECNFILLNTYTPIIYQVEYMEVGSAQFGLIDAMKEASITGLNTMQRKIELEFPNPKHTFTQKSSFNMLVTEINDLQEEGAMDLIVMGTQGASGLKGILFGTNTIHVLKDAKCPLLAIPNNFAFEEPHELLFPSDYEISFQEKHLQFIKDIATLHHSRINILHVTHTDELTIGQKLNKETLAVFFKNTAHLFHTVHDTNVAKSITEFQSKSRINLLAMINNKHSFFENLFFGSKVKKIGFHLNIPFLVIPAKA